MHKRPACKLGVVPARRPVCIDRDATIAAACRRMREQQVGELVVTECLDGKRAAAGIVSAKDVVRRVLALGLDAQVITVGDILWSRLPAAHVTDCVMETVERMSTSEGDTLLVLDAHGEIAGIVALDDVLFAYASALAWSPVH